MPPRHDKYQGLAEYPDGQWGIDAYIFGRRVRRKIGSEAKARLELQDLKAAERRGEVEVRPRKQTKRTIGDWIDKYLEVERGKSDQAFMADWKEMLGKRYPEQFKLEELKEWCHKLIREGMAASSVARRMDPMRACFKMIFDAGAISHVQNAFRNRKLLELPKFNNKRDEYLKFDLVPALAEAFGEFWWPYAVFAIVTHMRFGNQQRLRWDNIDWDARSAALEQTKKGVKTHTALSTLALDLLRSQWRRQQESGLVSEWCFPNSRGGQLDKDHFRERVWGPAFAKVGLRPAMPPKGRGVIPDPNNDRKRKGMNWHDLSRRTGVTWLANDGETDELVLQKLMEHEDFSTTQIYISHCAASLSKKRAAAERLAEMARTAMAGPKGVHKPSIDLSKKTSVSINAKKPNPAKTPFSQN
jgi:integrase